MASTCLWIVVTHHARGQQSTTSLPAIALVAQSAAGKPQ